MRRTFIIIAIIVILLGLGVAAYFLYFAGSTRVVVAPPGDSSLPVAGQGAPASSTPAPTGPAGAAVPVSARLVKVSSGPVVPGEAVIDIKAADANSSPDVGVTYIERQSGNVFSYLVGAGTLTRTSNKTLPGIQTASWVPDASIAFVRYLSGDDFSTINTYALPASSGSTGFFLPQDLSDIAVSSTSVLTLASGVNGSIASLKRTNGNSISTVFTMPISALRASFAGKSQYLAFSKPSGTLPGSAFLVDNAGRFSRIAGPANGLIALASPSGRWVLVSYIDDGVMHMNLVNSATAEITALPIATIADKCVWTADDTTIYCGVPMDPPAGLNYPDDWYQGALHFNDRLWKIQVAGRYAQLVLDFPTETKDTLDAQALAIDRANSVLVFLNKNDGSLWSYKL